MPSKICSIRNRRDYDIGILHRRSRLHCCVLDMVTLIRAFPPTREQVLLDSAIRILTEPREAPNGIPSEYILTRPSEDGTIDLELDNRVSSTTKEPIMARTKSKPVVESSENAFGDPIPGSTVVHEDGSTETFNPVPVREKTKQELNAEAAQAKILAKAEKTAERERALQAKKDEAERLKAGRLERIKANKEARDAKLAELGEGRTYLGSMLMLSERSKNGAYVKSGTGQLRCGDALALALDMVPPDNVIALGLLALELPENPYLHLNIGQRSMNLRNRMRGAIKKGTLTIETINALIKEHKFDTYTGVAEEKAAAAEKAKAEKAAKAAEKAAAKAAENVEVPADREPLAVESTEAA